MSTEEEIESFSALMDHHEGALKTLSEGSRDGAAYLLSPERAQRFELLTLLICNLGKPLAVCGPEGIGKTTFLGLLEERAFENWIVVSMRGNSVLQYGDIIARIAEQALINTSESRREAESLRFPETAISEYLEQIARNKKLLVLIIDDAGKLAPGVLTSLWQFSRNHPAFRLVLGLRPDEAQLKTATDGLALGECHFVDIPALTAPLCKAYLRRLATRPPRLLATEDITPGRVRTLYRATHGVPGRIVQMLTETPPAKERAPSGKLIMLIAALCASGVVAALMFAWYKPAIQISSSPVKEQPKPDTEITPISPAPAKITAPVATTTLPTTAPAPLTAAPVTAPLAPATPIAETPQNTSTVSAQVSPATDAASPAQPQVVAPPAPVTAKPEENVSMPPVAKEEPPLFNPLPTVSTINEPHTSKASLVKKSEPKLIAAIQPKAEPPSKKAKVEETLPQRKAEPQKPAVTAPTTKSKQQTSVAVQPPSKKAETAQTTPPAKPVAKAASKREAAKVKPELPVNVAKKPKTLAKQPAQTEIEDLASNIAPAKSKKPPTTKTVPIAKTPVANTPAQHLKPASSAPQPPAAAVVGENIAGVRPASWLLSQPAQSYTLRIMLVREWSSIKTLMQRYPSMQGQVITFKSHTNAGEWHSVYYGVFANEAEARQAATKLPAALGKALPRQIKQVQQEANTTRHGTAP